MGISLPPTGMTSAAAALRFWERRQEVVANNLANVDTDGFKAERVFAHLVDGAHPVLGAATDRSAGPLEPTGNALDVALGDAESFLVVDTPEGERLTRGGPLRFDEQHRLVTMDGHPVLGEDGPIRALPGELPSRREEASVDATADPTASAAVHIDRTGRVQLDGRDLGRLRVERVPVNAPLAHAGAGLFVPPPDARTAVPPEERDVRQGMLEGSNVNAVSTLVDMISIQRAYAAVQKAVTTLDGIRGTITSEIGRVG